MKLKDIADAVVFVLAALLAILVCRLLGFAYEDAKFAATMSCLALIYTRVSKP